MGFGQQFLPVLTFARIDIKRLFRDKVGIFFVFMFPLIFLCVFGFLFGRDDSSVSFNVAIVNQSDSSAARTFVEQASGNEVLSVKDVSSLDDARERMNRGELDATIVLPKEFGATKPGEAYPSGEVKVLYDQSKQQAGQTLASVLQESVFKPINQRISPSVEPFTVAAESTATEGLKPFDFTFAGLLGFSILSSGIFGPTTVFPRLKQKGVLRRYHTTPLKVWQYFLGNVMSTAAVGLLSLATMFIVARLLFDVSMRGDYASLIIFGVLGAVLLFGVGLAIGGWASNENQATPLANIVFFPLMFLSGVFFPTYLMPGWLQSIIQFTPLTPVVDGFRLILTEGYSLFQLGPQLLVIAAWMVVIYALAFRVFRWE